jgi:hypothetical protein
MSPRDWSCIVAELVPEVDDEDLRDFLKRERLASKDAVRQAIDDATALPPPGKLECGDGPKR